MSRYPHLPEALHQLLESGPWTGTPTELYATLEPHRQGAWPSNPVALSLWLRNHAGRYGISAEYHHTGECRLLRLARCTNGLDAPPPLWVDAPPLPARWHDVRPDPGGFWRVYRLQVRGAWYLVTLPPRGGVTVTDTNGTVRFFSSLEKVLQALKR